MAKQVKRGDVDRISELHDSILSHILSFPPTKQAVVTSVLSTRWRYLFALLPNIDFDLDEITSSRQRFKCRRNTGVESFWSFVDRILFFHNLTNTDKFHVKCEMLVDPNRFYGWISAAVQRGVKHLDFDIYISPDGKFTTLPPVLFTCSTLTTLKLAIIPLELDVPKDVRLPNLKTLHLKLVSFSNDDSVKSLLSGCTSLEELVLTYCYIKTTECFNISHHLLKRLTIIIDHLFVGYCLTIDTPNLAYFKYEGFDDVRFSHETLQSLVKADIGIFKDNRVRADATSIFRCISKVSSLNLSYCSLELLLSCEPLPIFATMVKLKIKNPSWSRWNKLETLLSNSPELEELVFPEVVLRSVPKNVPCCLLYKLKVIEISNSKYNKSCIRKAKYILTNGGALEKLTILITPNVNYGDEEKSKISQELLALPSKSKRCRIFVSNPI